MKIINIKLIENHWRPVTRLYIRNALIDTGAIVPVISIENELLNHRFKAKLLKENVYAMLNYFIDKYKVPIYNRHRGDCGEIDRKRHNGISKLLF